MRVEALIVLVTRVASIKVFSFKSSKDNDVPSTVLLKDESSRNVCCLLIK